MLQEAVEKTLLDDLRDGLLLVEAREGAPDEDWRWFLRALQDGTRVPLLDALHGSDKFAMLITVAFIKNAEKDGRFAIVPTWIRQMSLDAFIYPRPCSTT